MSGLNNVSIRPLSAAKKLLLPSGTATRSVRRGLLRGIKLEIDFHTQTQLFLGFYETETFAFCRAATARAKWLIDVGAGAGELSLYFMKVHGPSSVFAFEPLDTSRSTFLRNLAANGWSLCDLNLSSAFVGTTSSSVALDKVPVDSTQHGFIKIDVDGAETDVLRSAAGLLRSHAADLLVEVHSKALEQECFGLLQTLNYRVSIIDNAWWRLFIPEGRPIEHNRWLMAEPNR